ncbi:MAG: zinc ribbon domain-containing protein [Anaerolineales bacterium]|nr:zinc ribbon domain-containing protein [Anaerolineales bacterium]
MNSYVHTIVREYSSRIEDDHIFFAPDLSLEKVKNAVGSYASAAKDEEPLVLIDDTVFGNAKKGVLLTDKAIYAHETMESPQSLALSSIKSVSFKKGFLSSKIHINGRRFIDCTLPDKKALSLFAEMLGRIPDGFDAHEQAPSRELEVGTEQIDQFAPSEPAEAEIKQETMGTKIVQEGIWTCQQCGHTNSRENAFCPKCGNERGESVEAASLEQGDAPQGYYEKATQIIKDAFRTLRNRDLTPESVADKRSDLLSAASYLRLAIERSQGDFPEACADLSYLMLLLEENTKAKKYANMAIVHQPHNFEARMVLFFLTCANMEEYDPHIDNSSFTGLLLSGGWATLRRSGKKSSVTTAARNLVAAFQHTMRGGNIETEDFENAIFMADILLVVGETLHDYGMRCTEVYAAVATAPWDQVDLGEFAEQAMDLRAKAEGLLHLHG